MKKLLIIFCIFANFLQAQNNLTDEEVLYLDSLITYLEAKDSLTTIQLNNFRLMHEQDTIMIFYQQEKIKLLDERLDMYIELTALQKPKWYDKKGIWFALGAATIVTTTYVYSRVY
jgi:hypothetical protein|tara:strand:- start:217 stop:564 length:348 start_codon:yes stop_codon:yes gene_type:complete